VSVRQDGCKAPLQCGRRAWYLISLFDGLQVSSQIPARFPITAFASAPSTCSLMTAGGLHNTRPERCGATSGAPLSCDECSLPPSPRPSIHLVIQGSQHTSTTQLVLYGQPSEWLHFSSTLPLTSATSHDRPPSRETMCTQMRDSGATSKKDTGRTLWWAGKHTHQPHADALKLFLSALA
jgi:hypothetical protein